LIVDNPKHESLINYHKAFGRKNYRKGKFFQGKYLFLFPEKTFPCGSFSARRPCGNLFLFPEKTFPCGSFSGRALL
jgi:hypothetical protein